MSFFDAWLSNDTQINTQAEVIANRAILAWRRIQEKPTVVTMRNSAGASQGSVTVRIESDNRATPSRTAAGQAPLKQLIVFGVRNHPDVTVLDTPMDENYYFNIGHDRYIIHDIVETLGEVQGIAEATR